MKNNLSKIITNSCVSRRTRRIRANLLEIKANDTIDLSSKLGNILTNLSSEIVDSIHRGKLIDLKHKRSK